ncbi:protein lethal(2)essential for life-like [Cylas formicarius]|uniref:protein lethal(2)essential for life-like n=1 Tax=Cylas formicarius TaxID=197179 RepID=UPI002958BA24|nr:protein lethal(2)essential for life-like [Cylas formicarius]
MALSLPHFFGHHHHHNRPSRLLDQHFGLGLHPDDFLQPVTSNHRILSRTPAGYLRDWRPNASSQDIGSTLSIGKDEFRATLDVQQFKPEEITVKLNADNVLTIEGKHEEKEDEHGFIYRHFVRRYVLPKTCHMDRVESKLSSDGVLTITAPFMGAIDSGHKHIPITHTGEPARLTEPKK